MHSAQPSSRRPSIQRVPTAQQVAESAPLLQSESGPYTMTPLAQIPTIATATLGHSGAEKASDENLRRDGCDAMVADVALEPWDAEGHLLQAFFAQPVEKINQHGRVSSEKGAFGGTSMASLDHNLSVLNDPTIYPQSVDEVSAWLQHQAGGHGDLARYFEEHQVGGELLRTLNEESELVQQFVNNPPLWATSTQSVRMDTVASMWRELEQMKGLEADLPTRVQRVARADEEATDVFEVHQLHPTFSISDVGRLLVDDEKVVCTIPCHGFMGFPCADEELSKAVVGDCFMVLTSRPGLQEGEKLKRILFIHSGSVRRDVDATEDSEYDSYTRSLNDLSGAPNGSVLHQHGGGKSVYDIRRAQQSAFGIVQAQDQLIDVHSERLDRIRFFREADWNLDHKTTVVAVEGPIWPFVLGIIALIMIAYGSWLFAQEGLHAVWAATVLYAIAMLLLAIVYIHYYHPQTLLITMRAVAARPMQTSIAAGLLSGILLVTGLAPPSAEFYSMLPLILIGGLIAAALVWFWSRPEEQQRVLAFLRGPTRSTAHFVLSAHKTSAQATESLCALIKKIERFNCQVPVHLHVPEHVQSALNSENESWTAIRTLAQYHAVYLRWLDPCTMKSRETVCVVRPDVSLADTMHFVSQADAARTNFAAQNHGLVAPNVERTLQRYAAGHDVPHLPAFAIGQEVNSASTTTTGNGKPDAKLSDGANDAVKV